MAPTTETHIHTTTVSCGAECTPVYGGGAHTITCTCGERVTYNGHAFTQVEAERHAAWHAKQAR